MLIMTAHGRIGRDAELRETDGGTSVLDLAVACNYGRKGDDNKRPTQWIKATIWGKQAAALEPYLTKGKGVALILRDVHVRTYEKNDGSTGVSLEGMVSEIEFTGAGPRESDAASPAPAPAPKKPAPKRPADDDWDDDVPF